MKCLKDQPKILVKLVKLQPSTMEDLSKEYQAYKASMLKDMKGFEEMMSNVMAREIEDCEGTKSIINETTKLMENLGKQFRCYTKMLKGRIEIDEEEKEKVIYV